MSLMGFGYAKTILFGEHFVVYGVPAIAAAVDRKTAVWAETNKGRGLEIVADEKKHNVDTLKIVTKALAEKMGVEADVKLFVATEIPIGSGMGSSAAFCVATARALADCFRKKVVDEEVSRMAYGGEKLLHGNPSGIDNTVSTFGGLIWFKRNLQGGSNTTERLKLKKPAEIVIGNSGKQGNTKEMVAAVRARKEKELEKYEGIFKEAEKLVLAARKNLMDYKLEEVGRLMNENFVLLQEIGVSTKELDKMCKAAVEAGAFGAKLTGAGGGGCMIALCKEGESGQVAKAIEKLGFTTLQTRIGV